ncbi:MAG TPA: AAA family ATPase [Cytophagales bacterium]|nr:AAA family ATPase [Cytophagales bacterium]
MKSNNLTEEKRVLSSDELIEKHKDYELEFVMDNYIVKGANNFLTAEGGTGKTRFSLCLSYSLLYGLTSYLDSNLRLEGNVLYLNFEMDEPQFKVIAEPINNYYKTISIEKSKEFYIYTFAGNSQYSLGEIEQEIKVHNVKLVIIDSFKGFMSRLMLEKKMSRLDNLNSYAFFDMLNNWKRKLGVTTLTINHTNKGTSQFKTSGDIAFGPSSIRDFMDHQFFLRYASDNKSPERLMILDKTRFSANGNNDNLITLLEDQRGLRFEITKRGINEDAYMIKRKPHPKTQEIIELINQGKTYLEITAILNVSKQIISSVKKQMSKTEDML